ncbi:hypothetical protein H257_18617 [Aphanomyces astaci]|uniref:Reverse transcriptase domain-containing protein n=1 Tax=Aphanomyces astaci TaxID=112090 RepID=W4FC51_APHAT|nr:hypothetical protein H257_18617 [Aphanomyces astaci]ETV64499.1 hypothetical protein H257_18617 [Aphanomyces astaci]|eukprot:XP_009846014.1 hypothetical protein H257_18617 [Aphanomyces astaci]
MLYPNLAAWTHGRAVTQADQHENGGYSSDDSRNSECSDASLAGRPRTTRGKRQRRTWTPRRTTFIPARTDTDVAVQAEIRRREDFASGTYIGDPLHGRRQDNNIRIASTNINKQTWPKMHEEIANWFLANAIDVLFMADSDWGARAGSQVWTAQQQGGPAPGLIIFGHGRVAMVFLRERWTARIDRRAIQYSPSGRSLMVPVRLGQVGLIWFLGTYGHDNPHTCMDAVRLEWEWLSDCNDRANAARAIVIAGGDWNTYGTSPHDRRNPETRPANAYATGQEFEQWLHANQWVSTFRLRWPDLDRHTYQRANTATTLDDIFINTRAAWKVTGAGIWLDSIHSSDHVGTPVVELRLDTSERSRHRLQDVQAIKGVNTRRITPTELARFGPYITDTIRTGAVPKLIPPCSSEQPDEVTAWLELALSNVTHILYRGAALLWGETSQTRTTIHRDICVKRTIRCNGHWRHIMRQHAGAPLEANAIILAVRGIEWPKWVIDPLAAPEDSPHRTGATQIREWKDRPPEQASDINAWQNWLLEGFAIWKRTCRTRRNWRDTQRRVRRTANHQAAFSTGRMRSFIRQVTGPALPPVHIKSVMIRDANDQTRYSERRRDVEAGLRATLDNWIPANERTTRPTHLDTWDVRDGPSAPRFIREWLVDDMAQPPPIHHAFLHNGKCTWDAYRYDADCQAQCDRTLRRGVSPGFGGVSQELWIAAPPAIRERESLIINTILRTGLVPPSLKRKQMIFLPKAATAHGVVGLDPGSPPWRPITVQSAFASRVFTVIRNYIGPQLPNEELQHGFQRHRTVHDAAILTTLLLERAQRKGHELFLVSKDCLKCYDRVPGWVMEYVYLQNLAFPQRHDA